MTRGYSIRLVAHAVALAVWVFCGAGSAEAGGPVVRVGGGGIFPPRSACWSGPVVVRSWNCSPYWGWNTWGGWNSWYWGPEVFSVTYGNPAPVVSSGFGTLSAPATRIHRVPEPVKLTEPLVIHEGTSFRWRK